jgi:hypothetical protein
LVDEEELMEKRLARHKGYKNIYIHNDLAGAAFYFKETIGSKLAVNDRKGIAFDYMTCLLLLAFTFEAQINFLGLKLISDWKERQPFSDKVDAVLKHLGMTPDWTARPYKTIGRLKEFRDLLAHGKPDETEFDEVIDVPDDEPEGPINLTADWVKYCDHDSVFNSYGDMDLIWKQLLEKSGIEVFETLTQGSGELVGVKSQS